ncbi:cytochrome b [Rhodococcus jostii]|uniref:cytochrome b n=1 Tax=Rhodococcus jostii TaxID=132919 RepID=UPI00365042B9
MTADPPARPLRFAPTVRLLHWAMAVMVIAQLLVGAVMVTTLDHYHLLRAVHVPLGAAILLLVIVRIGNRLVCRTPATPATMGPVERRVATASEYLLYGLLVIQPLTGWAMLSAGGNPITLYQHLHLPTLLAPDPTIYAVLRRAHTAFAYLLFFTFTAHMTAVLFHVLVLTDRLLDRMAPWRTRRESSPTASRPAPARIVDDVAAEQD